MRPAILEEVVGQGQVLKAGTPIDRFLKGEGKGAGTSVILWGPPGTGKTSIAHVIARQSSANFEQLSAISAGVKEVRAVVDTAKSNATLYGKQTILFLDEIHRFSKAQQDSLLPAVEAGWITLIAATTENPSFSVISPLLSRAVIVKLSSLKDEELMLLIQRACNDARGFAGLVQVDDVALQAMATISAGDARRALTLLETSAFNAWVRDETQDSVRVSPDDVKAGNSGAQVRYDRNGDSHYDTISAFIKSVRGSDADAAIHYLAKMVVAGEDPRFIARRLIILAAEDVGLADPNALPMAVAAADAVQLIGMPEGRIPLAEATIYLCLAPKSNSAYQAINEAISDVESGMGGEVPPPLRGSAYASAAAFGSGLGYIYPHDLPAAVAMQQYPPTEIVEKRYYQPKPLGRERDFADIWARLRQIIRGEK